MRRLVATLLELVGAGCGFFCLGHWKRGLFSSLLALIGYCALSVAGAFGSPAVFYICAVALIITRLTMIVLCARSQPREPSRPWRVTGAVLAVAAVFELASTVRQAELFENYRVPGNAMYPNLLAGNHFVASRAVGLQRGDIVVVAVVEGGKLGDHLKRIVGLAHETVSIEDNRVSINGHAFGFRPITDACLQEEPCTLAEEQSDGSPYKIAIQTGPSRFMAPVTVPEGHVFVLGDNRGQSFDSRAFGPVPVQNVRGTLQFVIVPLQVIEEWFRHLVLR